MTEQTPRYGCGPGKKLIECSPQERVPDAELWRRIAQGLQQAADAAMTLATRQVAVDEDRTSQAQFRAAAKRVFGKQL